MDILEQIWYYLVYYLSLPLNLMGLGHLALPILIAFIIVYRLISKARSPMLQANWNTHIDNFTYSTEEFYKQLEAGFKSKGIQELTTKAVTHPERHIFSPRRKYLSAQWKTMTYECCLAPFGNGVFVSWWMYSKRSIGEVLVAAIPFIGEWLVLKWFPVTFYQYDTASMFRTSAQHTVLDVINDITKETGFRLTEQQKTPVLNDIFKR